MCQPSDYGCMLAKEDALPHLRRTGVKGRCSTRIEEKKAGTGPL